MTTIHARQCWKCWLWYDNMLMSTTLINQLLACASTQQKLTYHPTHVSLEHFAGKAVNVVVVCVTQTINPEVPPRNTLTWRLIHSFLRMSFWAFKNASYRRRTSGPLTDTKVFAILGLGWSHQKDLNRLPPISWWKWKNIWHFWPLWRKIHLCINCRWQENPISHASQCLNPGDILV